MRDKPRDDTVAPRTAPHRTLKTDFKDKSCSRMRVVSIGRNFYH